MQSRRNLIILIILGVGVTTLHCKSTCFVGNEIVIPSSDATPPSPSMDIHLPNKPMMTVSPTSGPLTASVGPNDVVTLMAAGNDSEGIRDIQIFIEETTWTSGTVTGPGLVGAPSASNRDATSPGGKGCSSRLATLNLDIAQHRRQATALRIRTWATAVNFAGTEVKTDVVTLNWP